MTYETAWKTLMATIGDVEKAPDDYARRKIVTKARALELRIEYDGEEQHEVVDR